MTRVTSRILVPFHGEGAGLDDMTWAQLMIWQAMRDTGRSMNIGGTVSLPAGTLLADMVRMLRFVVTRHEALRTRLRLDPDRPPQQVVSESGEIALEIVDVTSEDDADAAAEEVRLRYMSVPFDYPVEWPIRMGVVRHDQALTHLIVVYCHVAVDGFGIDALARDLAYLDPSTGQATATVVGLTPLEQTAKQRTPAGLRQSEKSVRYWEQLIRSIPPQRFGTSADPREPRFWEFTVRSPAMHLALQAISRRTGIGVGYVVLAVYAVSLARRTGRSPAVAQLAVSNRFRPGFADSVSVLVQTSICVIDVVDATFDEVVARAWKASIDAYMHGYFDPAALNDMKARVRRDRGEVDISCLVNDRRALNASSTLSPVATPEEIRTARPLTTSWWSRTLDVVDYSLIVNVDAAPDAVDVAILADTHCMGPVEIEALALEMEAVAIESAHDAGAATARCAASPAGPR